MKKPTKPRAPKKPQEYQNQSFLLYMGCEGHEFTIKELREKILEYAKQEGEEVDPDEVSIVLDEVYNSQYYGAEGGDISCILSVKNPNYENHMKSYQKRLDTYKDRMASYKDKMKEYDKHKEYENEAKAKQIHAQIAELNRKLKSLEK